MLHRLLLSPVRPSMGSIGLSSLALLWGAQALAQPPVPLLPLEQLLSPPRVTTVQIDPAGKTLAVIEMVGDHRAIVLYTRQRERLGVVFRDTSHAVSNVRWSGDGRWLLVLHDRGGDEGYHLLRIDPQHVSTVGQATATDLTPFPGAAVELLATPVHGGAIIASNHRDARVSDVYQVDLASGALTPLARNPGDVTVWTVNPRGMVAAASAVRADGTLEVRVPGGGTRAPSGIRWRTVYRAPPAERFTLLSVDGSTGYLLARSNAGAMTERFVYLDPRTGRIVARRVSACRGFDAGEMVRALDGRVLGESCATSHRNFVPDGTAAQRRLREAVRQVDEGSLRAAPADSLRALEFESASQAGDVLVFYSHAATDPGRYLLYDAARGVIDTAFPMRPEIDRAALAASRFQWFTARDGMRLSMVLTRSRVGGSDAKSPAVVVVHGGPWTRDEVGYSGETQLLANRGYTVMQVNFRGSTGLGRATVDGAVGEFGRRMSDDLLDAIAWSVRHANVDATRVCILGGSYGGFAALVGMTRDASHYRCGIDYAGPFDLETLVRAFPASWQPFLPRSWYRFVGNPEVASDRERMRMASPLAQLAKARGPLLVFHGDNDPRVRTDQALRVVQAWRGKALPVTLLLATNEGHSFNEAETGLAVNRAVEQFLGEWLGGRVQPQVAPRVSAALQRLRAAGDSASRGAPPR